MCSKSTQTSDQFNVLATEFAELEADYNCLEHSVCDSTPAGPISLETSAGGAEPCSSSLTPVASEQLSGLPFSCEPTVCDSREQEDLQQFLSNTCKCTLGPGGKPWCLLLSMEIIQRSRDKCAELSHNEPDLVVMAQIHSLRTVEHQACQGTSSATFRPICSYFIHGVKICQATFFFSTEFPAIVTFASCPCTMRKDLYLVYMGTQAGFQRTHVL